ncbi:unnamed protein product [Euphydryas editha]|uniref:Uncharacterized protein n=1 Tax=Euphydryas editha TaxID=104508 RepID=A0AAU9TFN3_EUPED|nr:unnamed protein product [Euphydryas editha]
MFKCNLSLNNVSGLSGDTFDGWPSTLTVPEAICRRIFEGIGTGQQRWAVVRALLHACCLPPPDSLNQLINPHSAYEERSPTLPIADFTARSTRGGGGMSDLKDLIIGVRLRHTGGEGTIATSLLPVHLLNSRKAQPAAQRVFAAALKF